MTLASRHRPVTVLAFQTSASTSETVTIALRQVTNPAKVSLINQQLGLDGTRIILEGRLVDPLRRPDGLKAKHKAPLTWAGRSGIAMLEPYQGAITDAWRDKYGDALLLTWASDV